MRYLKSIPENVLLKKKIIDMSYHVEKLFHQVGNNTVKYSLSFF